MTKMWNEAVSCADELIILIDAMIPKRRKTINVIKKIAAKLTAVNKNVNIAKVVGFATSIIGGIAGAAGVILTGGLATPLIIFGGATVIGGTATNFGADIVGHVLSKDKLKEAQCAFNDDKEISINIDKKKQNLDVLIDKLGERLNKKRDEVFTEVMIESLLIKNDSKNFALLRGIMISSNLIKRFAPRVYSVCNAAKIASAIEKVGVKGLTKMFGSVFSIVTGVAFIILDVALLVNTSVKLHKGSKTEAASDLLLYAEKLEEGTNNLDRMLIEFRDVAKEFQATIEKENLRKELIEFSSKDCATDSERTALLKNIQKQAKKEWIKSMKNANIDEKEYVSSMTKIFRNFEQLLTDYKNEEQKKKNPRKRIPITMIGHGGIDKDRRLPCKVYYMTDSLKTVTLYEPWGCAIDTTVVHAIAVNKLKIANIRYSGEVYSSSNNSAERPTDWNILPEAITQIPTPTFYPLTPDEKAYKGLRKLIETMPEAPDGIVIPYIKGKGLVELPEAPLYTIVNALSLAASLSNIDIDFRYAACLTITDEVVSHRVAGVQQKELVSNTIYYSVDISCKPHVFMTQLFDLTFNIDPIQKWEDDNIQIINLLKLTPIKKKEKQPERNT